MARVRSYRVYPTLISGAAILLPQCCKRKDFKTGAISGQIRTLFSLSVTVYGHKVHPKWSTVVSVVTECDPLGLTLEIQSLGLCLVVLYKFTYSLVGEFIQNQLRPAILLNSLVNLYKIKTIFITKFLSNPVTCYGIDKENVKQCSIHIFHRLKK